MEHNRENKIKSCYVVTENNRMKPCCFESDYDSCFAIVCDGATADAVAGVPRTIPN